MKEQITLLALSRLSQLNLASSLAAKELRSEVEPGEYEGEADLRVKYKVRVGEPYEAVTSAAAPWRDLAIALMGKVSDPIRKRTLREVLHGEHPMNEDYKREVEDAVREILGETIKTHAGKTTGTCELEVV